MSLAGDRSPLRVACRLEARALLQDPASQLAELRIVDGARRAAIANAAIRPDGELHDHRAIIFAAPVVGVGWSALDQGGPARHGIGHRRTGYRFSDIRPWGRRRWQISRGL